MEMEMEMEKEVSDSGQEFVLYLPNLDKFDDVNCSKGVNKNRIPSSKRRSRRNSADSVLNQSQSPIKQCPHCKQFLSSMTQINSHDCSKKNKKRKNKRRFSNIDTNNDDEMSNETSKDSKRRRLG